MEKKKEKPKNEIVELIFGIIEPILFVVMSFVATQILRISTIGNPGYAQGVFLDLLIILIIACLSLLIRPKARTILLMTIFICICCGCIYENTHYNTYSTFSAVFNEITEVTFLTHFKEKSIVVTFTYILMMFIYFMYNITTFVILICTKKKGMTVNILVPIISLVCLLLFQIPIFFSFNSNDWNRLYKLWNREYVLEKFGVITYWVNDVYQCRNIIIERVNK